MKFFVLFCIFISINSYARFEIQTSSSYSSYSDGKTKYTFSDMNNYLFIGASLDRGEKLLIGNHLGIYSIALKSANNDTLSMTEIGPRINYYFNEEHTLYSIIGWNPYAKGKRKAAGGASEDVSGWAYLLAFGGAFKITKGFYLGASINYHALSITESVVSSTSTKVSHSYSDIMPMLNMTFRFR